MSALVYGDVTKIPGTAVGGTPVRAYVGAEPCAIRPATEEASRTTADGAGRFRMQLTSPYRAPRCVQVEVSATDGGTGRTEVPTVRFRPTGSLPYDSVRVDIRVP
jgi:hypothetical protein